MSCPHCGPLHDRVCRLPDGSIDKRPWTREERDAWRAQARRESPAIRFVESSQSSRMGERNRR